MNLEEKQLIDKYVKYRKKRNLIVLLIFSILIIFCVIFLFCFTSKNIKKEDSTIHISPTEENTTIETEEKTNEIQEQDAIPQESFQEKPQQNLVETPQPKVEDTKKEETKVQNTQEPLKANSSNKQVDIQKKDKPNNKDFLFEDGYTMDNVSKVAQDYLNSSGYSGKCIPIKDSDGVYLGMRVIFD